MTKSQRLCNGKVAVNAGKCDKVVKLVQRCNNTDSSTEPSSLYRGIGCCRRAQVWVRLLGAVKER